jgi:H+-transporting ATPase
MAGKSTTDYKAMKVEETLKTLNVNEKGLTEAEAAKRATEYGFNEVIEKKKNLYIDFLSRFWGPMPWLLELAAGLSMVVGQVFDGLLIFSLLVMNTVIGFFNENNSQKALELLKKRLEIRTNLLRDGKWAARAARELVPGDIITVRLGDVVPADAKIIEGQLSVDQAALTGESLPVEVKDSDILYTGSIVKRGEAKCVVVNTGMKTYFGKTVELVNIAKPKSKQEEVMLTICRYMMYVGVFAFILVAFYCIRADLGLVVILTFAAMFIGGAVPAALPVMFTVAQSSGATELAKKGILVTRLDAIENAASVQVLCMDKTGTITKNEMEVSDAIPFSGFKKEDVVLIAALASNEASKDAIDNSVLEYAKAQKAGFGTCKKMSFTPFEPATKRSEAVVELKGKKFKAIKGAPQVVLSLCKNTGKKDAEEFQKQIEILSKKGCRVLAVAKSVGKLDELVLVGLVALSDPIREDSAATIAEMKAAGIKPVMLTGDNISVAKQVAMQVGIGDNIARMPEVRNLDEKARAEGLAKYNGLAEIYPEDKYGIVKFLQHKGLMVGMTGDGVNDAPALKQAEMGVAVSNAADVAKAAASIVLIEPGTGAMIEAVKTSRKIYQRMLTWSINKIAKVVQFIGMTTVGLLWFHDVVLSISGLLLLVFVNDFMMLSLATDNAKSTASPSKWNVKNITIASGFLGILFMLLGIGLMWYGINNFGLQLQGIQTLVLLTLIYTSFFRVLLVRERGHFWDSVPGRDVSIAIVVGLIVFTAIAIAGFGVYPLAATQVAFVFLACLVFTMVLDPIKYVVFRRLGL